MSILKKAFILFLDFDGVLHPFFPRADLSDEENALWSYKQNFETCIRSLMVNYSVSIVISSNWRKTRELPELKGFFSNDIAKLIIGKNPVLNKLTNNREDECIRFMRERKLTVPWLALDDHVSQFNNQEKVVVCPDCFKVEQAEELRVKVQQLIFNASKDLSFHIHN